MPWRRKPPRLILLDAGALLAYLILAIAFTRPLWATLTNGIIGRIGDNIYFIWLVGWFKKAYFSLGVDPMNVWFLNYPAGWSLASTEIAPAQLAIAVPFALPGGETFGYNAALLISFALSGWFCYHWVASLTGSRRAGFLSGVIFACLPYRQAHFLAGHLNLSGTQWLPLFFWGWFEILRTDRADGRAALRPALLAALGLGLTALCSQYYAFMLIFLSGSLMILWLVFRDRKRLRSAAFWKTLAAFVVFSLPLLIVAEAPFLTLNASGALPDRDLSAVRQYSASVSDFFLPATTHFAWGGRVGAGEVWSPGCLPSSRGYRRRRAGRGSHDRQGPPLPPVLRDRTPEPHATKAEARIPRPRHRRLGNQRRHRGCQLTPSSPITARPASTTTTRTTAPGRS